ncbi:NAD-dependent protein deacylase [bacterium]|nr:NAD-dependent protein deacylase [bacterium]
MESNLWGTRRQRHHQRVTIPDELVRQLRSAQRVVVVTGAGVSAESGVPTFRDAQTGLWAKFKPEELATPEGFQANPRLVWEWYAWRRKMVAAARPNSAHFALREMEKLFPEFHLITQNVDGLHQRAGSSNVIELHGNITRTKCFNEGTIITTSQDSDEVPPRCPQCGGVLRPDVVWFGEVLPESALEKAAEVSANCDVFFSIGTSAVVYPAAALSADALRAGKTVVEINPEPTPLTALAHFVVSGAAGVVVPEIVNRVRSFVS